jgi:heat shock protein HslJ
LVALCLAGCREGGSDAVDVSTLAGKTWVLASLDGKPVLEGTRVLLEFSPAEGGIAGSGGCNHYFGNFVLKGKDLTISALGMTEMYCMDPEGVMEQEKTYLDALSAAKTVQVVDGQLRITYGGGATLVYNEES